MNSEVCKVLKVYLGAGETGGYVPYGHEQRMHDRYHDQAKSKLALIQKYLENDHPLTNWSTGDLASETLVFERMLSLKYPELDKVSINAIACRWSYAWR